MFIQFSCSVVSDTLRSHGLQHPRLSCLSSTPGVCSNSCPLNRWYHPTISSSVALFSFFLQSFPALGSFPMSQFFLSGGHSIGTSALQSSVKKKKNPQTNSQLYYNLQINWICSQKSSLTENSRLVWLCWQVVQSLKYQIVPSHTNSFRV